MKLQYIACSVMLVCMMSVWQPATAQNKETKEKKNQTEVKKKTDEEQKKILSEKVEVTKSYIPTIKKASKLDITPTIEKTENIEVSKIRYGINYKPERFPFTIRKLGIPMLPSAVEDKLYNGYADVMLGGPLSSRANIYYNSTSQRNLVFGAALNHNGFYGKLKNNAGSKISALDLQNMINVNLGYKRDNFEIGVSAQQSVDAYNRYGYSYLSEEVNAVDDNAQHFMKSNVEFTVGTATQGSSAFNIRFKGSYNYVVDKYNYQEHIYHAGLFLSKGFRNAGTLSLNTEYMSILPDKKFEMARRMYESGVSGTIDTKAVVTPTDDLLFGKSYSYQSYGSLALTPRYVFNYKGFYIDIAPKLVFDFSMINNDKSPAKFLPEVLISYSFLSGAIKPYVKVDGDYTFNSYYSLTSLNPYIKEGVAAPNTTERSYKLGIEGVIAGHVSYHVNGGLSQKRDLIMFRNINRGNVFDVTASDFDNTIFSAGLGYIFSQKLMTEVRYDYIGYDNTNEMGVESVAYGYPKHTGSLLVTYNVTKALSLDLQTKLLGERYFQSAVVGLESTNRIGATVDMCLGAEYRFNNRFSTKLRIENLLNQKLYPWGNYRGVGFNALVGVSYKF